VIPVAPAPEPKEFDAKCRIPGNAWLQSNPGTDPHKNALWTAFSKELRKAFNDRCGILGIYIHEGHVDHWVSLKTDRTRAFEWTNYRYLAGSVNTAKKPKWEGRLLDPFDVGEGWFEVDLPSCLIRLTDKIPTEFRARAQFTADNILNRPKPTAYRAECLKRWKEKKEIAVAELLAPLVAEAIRRDPKYGA
jgi:hypothetical protein